VVVKERALVLLIHAGAPWGGRGGGAAPARPRPAPRVGRPAAPDHPRRCRPGRVRAAAADATTVTGVVAGEGRATTAHARATGATPRRAGVLRPRGRQTAPGRGRRRAAGRAEVRGRSAQHPRGGGAAGSRRRGTSRANRCAQESAHQSLKKWGAGCLPSRQPPPPHNAPFSEVARGDVSAAPRTERACAPPRGRSVGAPFGACESPASLNRLVTWRLRASHHLAPRQQAIQSPRSSGAVQRAAAADVPVYTRPRAEALGAARLL